MFSYREFPEQVQRAFSKLKAECAFWLFDVREDHLLVYENATWIVKYYCDHGAVTIFLMNKKDRFEFSLYQWLEFCAPESPELKKFPENIWGCEETVNYQTEVLNTFYPKLNSSYETNSTEFKAFLKS